ncbi:MAG: PHP domain-containing protein, partial [Candidatus Puniceispirillaceae bacterium]
MPAPFVHLRVHSAYSLAESTLRLKSIVALAGGDSQPAVAITDTNNMFGALEFSEKMRESGVQPIIGVDCWVKGADGFGRLTLIAMNQEGYKNLLELLSLGWLKGQDGDF